MNLRKAATSALVVISLSACGGGSPGDLDQPVARKMVENYTGAGDPGPIAPVAGDFPTDYEEKVRAYLQRNMKDPDSFKDGKIATPFYVGRLYPSWIVCVQGRSKNSYGAYTGLKFFEMKMRQGEILPIHTEEGDEAWWCNKSENKLNFSKFTL